jgi:hypothetical protein
MKKSFKNSYICIKVDKNSALRRVDLYILYIDFFFPSTSLEIGFFNTYQKSNTDFKGFVGYHKLWSWICTNECSPLHTLMLIFKTTL